MYTEFSFGLTSINDSNEIESISGTTRLVYFGTQFLHKKSSSLIYLGPSFGLMVNSSQPDKVEASIQSLQFSTRSIIESFRDKTNSLSSYSNEIKLLLREGYDVKAARRAANGLFGSNKISFIAIDGTKAQDQALDMLLFYSGAFAYIGQLEFMEKGCECGEVEEGRSVSDISAAIPLYEEDASIIVGQETEAGLEVDPERLPSSLMHFAEYYLAVKMLKENADLKLVILDRTLAGDLGHLIWSVSDFIKDQRCILQGFQTNLGIVSRFDLDLVRMLHPNRELKIPAPRSQFLKYCAINLLISTTNEISSATDPYENVLSKIGAKPIRLTKLVNDIKSYNKEYSFLKADFGDNFNIDTKIKYYWERVLSATETIAQHIFETPPGQHPLLYEIKTTEHETNEEKAVKKWITSADLEYMTLVMIYALLRLAWTKNILVIGLIKDTGASELIKTIVPILRNSQKITMNSNLPQFNSDKQFLQSFSVVEGKCIKSPWRTFEFDACFRTVAPENKNEALNANEANVKGAHKNIITAERMFVKSYVQLWQSQRDSSVRSHVFSYDRPCYSEFDKPGELLLLHRDNNVSEEINPMIHFDKDSEVSHLVMDVLCSMANEVIPECLGHNYPLFLADKKAKYVLEQMKTSYLSTVAYEMANYELDQQILYQEKFRDFRSKIESSRRAQ
jgi:hypothetical protein